MGCWQSGVFTSVYSENEMSIDRYTQLLQSSVPLCRLNAEKRPTGSGMGCLADYHGHRLLLTVEHTTGDGGNWAIQVQSEPDKIRTQLYALGNTLNFLSNVSLITGEEEVIDFAYAKIPATLKPVRQDISDIAGKTTRQWPVTVFPLDFDLQATKEDIFGFSGLVKGQLELHPMVTFFASELKIYDGLKYLRTDRDKMVFKLPFEHPGHPEFKGCSGAPILNQAGMPIALLQGGCAETDEIYGISLSCYRTAIDILVR
jgi:hypothetical protein